MKHISLFSGIGGFDLAAEWAGWTNVASCEINPFGRRHLAYYWPHAYHHDDIKTLTGEKIQHEAQKRYGPDWRADGVILSGGFPCQPYSLAGKRLGKEDERHLWPEMLRVIREIQPTWIVGENVFGLVNWSDGLVFDEVQTDLEAQGYEVQAYVLPACAADAPHRRDRVWIVAHYKGPGIQPSANRREECIENGATVRYMSDANGEGRATTNTNRDGQQRSNGKNEVNASEGGQYAQRDTINGAEYGPTTNAANVGQKQPRNTREWRSGLEDSHSDEKRFSTYANGIRQPGEKHWHQESGFSCENSEGISWHNFPTQSPVCSRNDGIPAELDGITFPKWRNESIKAAGNAIVPAIAYRIFDTINQFHNKTK
jgi:DNA (cytosine-5)-methyltransferase 1